jgi:hypothetical protein
LVVEQLASEYKDQPVLFLEYDVDDTAYLDRELNFWYNHGGGGATLPLIAVDSGHQFSSGPLDFRTVYKNMVDTALSRPPQAELAAAWWREGNHVQVDVKVTNRSDVTLSGNNRATLYAVIYENNKVQLTNRYVRAQINTEIGGLFGLQPGETGSYTLATDNLSDVDWDKLSVVAILDYLPDPSVRKFDALQAAPAAKLDNPFSVSLRNATFLADPDGERPGAIRRETLSIKGAQGVTWTADIDVPWLTVTPSSGTTNTTVEVAVDLAQMQDGWQAGTVVFTAAEFERPVAIRAYRGEVSLLYLPLATK